MIIARSVASCLRNIVCNSAGCLSLCTDKLHNTSIRRLTSIFKKNWHFFRSDWTQSRDAARRKGTAAWFRALVRHRNGLFLSHGCEVFKVCLYAHNSRTHTRTQVKAMDEWWTQANALLVKENVKRSQIAQMVCNVDNSLWLQLYFRVCYLFELLSPPARLFHSRAPLLVRAPLYLVPYQLCDCYCLLFG